MNTDEEITTGGQQRRRRRKQARRAAGKQGPAGSRLTSAEKQAKRRARLNEIAQAHGWENWSKYATAVLRGGVVIPEKPASSEPEAE